MPLNRNDVYTFGPFRLDVRERRLLRGHRPLPLRAKVFDTLCALVAQSGKLVSKEELIQAVWPDAAVEEGNLAHNITALRKLLGERDDGGKYIETVSGKGYRFIAEVNTDVRAASPSGPSRQSRLVGRDRDLESLAQILDDVARGTRRTVCISGDAGVGKTSLLNVLFDQACERRFCTGRGQCLEGLGEGEAYMPLLEAVSQMCRGPDGDRALLVLHRVAPAWLVQMPWLLPSRSDELQNRTLGVTKERMLRELAEALEVLSAERPVVLAIEDLHWSDASTVQAISLLTQRTAAARILIAGTYRPKEVEICGLPIHAMTQQLRLRGLCREFPLQALDDAGVRLLIEERLPGLSLSTDAIAMARRRTEGIPLFVEAVVDHWKAQGLVSETGGRWTVNGPHEELGRGIPGSLQAMIRWKIDSLDEQQRRLVEAASVLGVEFSTDAVAAALDEPEEAVETKLEQLARRGSLVGPGNAVEWPDGTVTQGYTFVHSLYQEALYENIPAGRRARLHLNVAVRLERAYGANSMGKSAELAHHFLRGRDTERALPHVLASAELALRRSAHREAIALCRRGLEILAQLPVSPSTMPLEFRFQAALAPALISVEGFASQGAERAYNRAAELGKKLGRTEALLPLMFGQAAMHELRGEFDKSEQVLNSRLELLHEEPDSGVIVSSDALMACSMFHQGQFTRSLGHADRGASTYNPHEHLTLIAPYGETPGPSCHEWGSLSTWFLGYPDRALARIEAAIATARTPDHLFSLASVLVRAALVRQLRREPEEVVRAAKEAGDLAESHGYGWVQATAVALMGSARAAGGGDFSDLERGLDMLAAMGAHLDRPYFLALLAETAAAQGDFGRSNEALAEAFRYVGQNRAHFYEAELYRLKGWTLLESGRRDRLDEAEANLHVALSIAARQQAKSLELRAGTDLCAVCRRRGRVAGAARELSRIYSWFTEAFDTPDLVRARQMLEDLERLPAASSSTA
jgi:DNA-binding winged helix-turn-helix (wHTH) protein/tetratricopeptide (TPR) repeat protein